MISSVFKKSTPLNLILILFLTLTLFIVYQLQDIAWTSSALLVVERVGILGGFLITVFLISNFSKQNRISNDSRFTILFYLFFTLFFPDTWSSLSLILANFSVFMGIRRLLSLQVLSNSKEKIFDASLWIFLATVFHFWSILFLFLVFVAIIVHAANDYRNWILPFIAMLAVTILFSVLKILYDIDFETYFNRNVIPEFEINYFTTNYQNVALAIYATVSLFFMVAIFFHLPTIPLNLHTTLYKIIVSFFIGIAVFVVSPNKSNDILIFTIAPLAILATAVIEILKVRLEKDLILLVLIGCSLFSFITQL